MGQLIQKTSKGGMVSVGKVSVKKPTYTNESKLKGQGSVIVKIKGTETPS